MTNDFFKNLSLLPCLFFFPLFVSFPYCQLSNCPSVRMSAFTHSFSISDPCVIEFRKLRSNLSNLQTFRLEDDFSRNWVIFSNFDVFIFSSFVTFKLHSVLVCTTLNFNFLSTLFFFLL